jgi:hypothetical protein
LAPPAPTSWGGEDVLVGDGQGVSPSREVGDEMYGQGGSDLRTHPSSLIRYEHLRIVADIESGSILPQR